MREFKIGKPEEQIIKGLITNMEALGHSVTKLSENTKWQTLICDECGATMDITLTDWGLLAITIKHFAREQCLRPHAQC
jgi:hypothetical protein